MRPSKVDLFATIAHEVFPAAPSKAQERKLQILEAAIRSYTEHGIEQTTPARIAKFCNISRPLVLHYFPDQECLFDDAIRYIRAIFQEIAVASLKGAKTPRDQVVAYISSTFKWVERYRSHAEVWLLFYYYCAIDKKRQRLHSELVAIGHRRIQALIESGVQSGAFVCADPLAAAKLIQVIISGALLACLTEKSELSARRLEEEAIRACFILIGLD